MKQVIEKYKRIPPDILKKSPMRPEVLNWVLQLAKDHNVPVPLVLSGLLEDAYDRYCPTAPAEVPVNEQP